MATENLGCALTGLAKAATAIQEESSDAAVEQQAGQALKCSGAIGESNQSDFSSGKVWTTKAYVPGQFGLGLWS